MQHCVDVFASLNLMEYNMIDTEIKCKNTRNTNVGILQLKMQITKYNKHQELKVLLFGGS